MPGPDSDDSTPEQQWLQSAVKGVVGDVEEWPKVLEWSLARLTDNAYKEFPVPVVPPPQRNLLPSDVLSHLSTQDTVPVARSNDDGASSSQESQGADKENAPPAASTTSNGRAAGSAPPPAPSNAVSTPPPPPSNNSTQGRADSHRTSLEGGEAANGSMPAVIVSQLEGVLGRLRDNFKQKPPHTVQRLAELVLLPRQHYRFLPAYLNALDRVVSVSSDTNVFPLPQAILPGSVPGLANGMPASAAAAAVASINGDDASAASLGSDESLGGALLTPIHWLRPNPSVNTSVSSVESDADITPTSSSPSSVRSDSNNGSQGPAELRTQASEMVDGPNGAGRIETVSVVNGVVTTTVTHVDDASSSANATSSISSSADTATSTPAVSSTSTTTSPNIPTDLSQAAASLSPGPRHYSDALREAGAVTQGELLRQEQEAGVVPVAHAALQQRRTRQSGQAQALLQQQSAGAEADSSQSEPSTNATGENTLPPAATSEVSPLQDRNDTPTSPASATSAASPARATTLSPTVQTRSQTRLNAQSDAQSQNRRSPARSSLSPPPHPSNTASATANGKPPVASANSVPHARGPEEITMADTGPMTRSAVTATGGLDMEAAVGRPGQGELTQASASQTHADAGANPKPDGGSNDDDDNDEKDEMRDVETDAGKGDEDAEARLGSPEVEMGEA